MKIFNVKYIPLTIVTSFNIITLLIFYTAPINWKTNNLFLFFIFSSICQLMIIGGYYLGYGRKIKSNIAGKIFFSLSSRQFDFVFYFYAATFLIKYAYLLRFAILDVVGMVSFLGVGIVDPSIGYALSIESTKPFTVSWSLYFLISIVNHVFFIVGFIKWKDMGRLKKWLFIFFVFIELFYWMGRGTNFGTIIMITTFSFSILYRLRSIKLNTTQLIQYMSAFGLLLVISISIFSFNMSNRRGGSAMSYEQFDLGRSYVDENSIAFNVLPEPLLDTYMYMVSYLAQGYYHTCLAFDLDYKPTYLVGSNPASTDFAKIFGIDVYPNTYVYRLKEKGVDPSINWHSSYTWYASDVTFWGVPIVFLLIGYLLGLSWNLSLNRDDFLSKIVFIVMANMVLFIFSNNTYLASVFYSFMFILPIWYYTRILRFKLS